MMRQRHLLVCALAATGALVAATPAAVSAQPSGCSVLAGTRSVQNITTPSGPVAHMGRPRLRCIDGRYMQADSLVHYQQSGYTNMLGHVVFRTDGRELRADSAQYFEGIGRLEAQGNVELTELERGTVITGQELLYLRAGPQRPQEQLTVTGERPRAVLYPRRDTLREEAAPAPDSVTPYEIVADRIYLVGDQFLQAEGTVGVVRDSLLTFSDSLNYDQVGGSLDLSGRPARIVQGQLDLVGREIRVLLPGDVIEEVVAREEAVLTTDSLDVDAPFIRIFMDEGRLQRLVAAAPSTTGARPTPTGPARPGGPPGGIRPDAADVAPDASEAEADSADAPPRARAVGSTITMVADSIDVLAPAQRLERMVAVGSARAVSTARDTLNTPDTPEELRHDWIEGDTVRAGFAPSGSETGDAAGNFALESLEARINARSLYRLDPDSAQVADTTAFRGRLPVNYTEADGIVLYFDDGTVTRMEWNGLHRGIQLQPVRRPDESTGTGRREGPQA